MNFRIIQSKSSADAAFLAYLEKNFEAYTAYLASIKHLLPPSVYAFATKDWHYDPQNPTCPHDAWIQEIRIKEIAQGERGEIRETQIEVILLGAHHDRLLKLTYLGVKSYSMTAFEPYHGDWMTDEIRISEAGMVIHEIEFQSKAVLMIECKDILFEEKLTDTPYTTTWSG